MQADFRYERGVFTLEDNTKIKLCNQLGVKKVEDLTVEQKDFCEQYHAYMVQPFPDDPRWSSLASFAYSSCKTVLPVLPKLEHVGCGICLPEDFPTPTSTNSFVKRWRNSVAAVNPVYIYDFDVNLAWISGIALHSVPLHVKSLGMSAANLATLSSMVTVNRILSTICNIHKLSQNPVHRVGTMAVTELSLTIGGIRGTHGIDTWAGNTGSIGMVKYWADAINLLPNLTYLALVGDRMELPGAEQMSNDLDHGWMTWLFRSLVSLRHLESFSLYYFTITPETIPQVFQSMSESLRHVSFRDVSIDLEDSKHNHAKLGSWSEQVAWLTKRFQSARVIMKGYHIGEFYTNDKTDSKDYPESRAALAKLGVEFEE
ncbi:hypothetical protein BU16DRAFT_242981 [Lophium mytilinum]|uniref:Uncharacterized protein n=1 Tax=Lophium mytilinum TaxID=390894 RepID=A0A6A6R9Z5_9PEZI|nr:hypothetical protein BU16DRAFT_242981 [Lophium mytilinum]